MDHGQHTGGPPAAALARWSLHRSKHESRGTGHTQPRAEAFRGGWKPCRKTTPRWPHPGRKMHRKLWSRVLSNSPRKLLQDGVECSGTNPPDSASNFCQAPPPPPTCSAGAKTTDPPQPLTPAWHSRPCGSYPRCLHPRVLSCPAQQPPPAPAVAPCCLGHLPKDENPVPWLPPG